MVNCLVNSCKNFTNKKNKVDDNVKYFRFPRDEEIRKKWIDVCQIKKDVNIEYARLCSDHFTYDDYLLKDRLLNTPLKKLRLKKDAIPTKKLPILCDPSDRLKRIEKRCNKKIVEELLIKSENENVVQDNCDEIMINYDTKLNMIKEEPNTSTNNDVGTQTMIDLNNMLEMKVMELEKELKKIKSDMKILTKQSGKATIAYKNLQKFFTNGQIKKLYNLNKRIVWSTDDISSAIRIHSVSPRCYKYLYCKGYPLPGISTLRKWISSLKHKPEAYINTSSYNE